MKTESKIEKNRFKNFSAEKKLELAIQLRNSAIELKRAALREFHPTWSEEKVVEEVKKIFLYART
ncbi:MAG: hypothetical protein AUK34_05345 [Ignavibacteria bacterium CG2_30_36_16]|nr:hypothetical protein [Ignavibacteria bacterium]OIP61167.1 MAG: hypothetical protein AUK34_05345 [Ignavibacteria bacterium CG2_30_36_16]PIQ08135.1 MAG: hypothetical protein COW71_13455 [Ignavibacteriales bacterium CG18_big_fil_WC_8_21_14_2_50_31_20]PJA99862.1 MAG: hypothetical protein CO127_09785 [Ignavibacteria bacterium CG_4_9_14_3_um_filter_36_18]